MEVWSDITIIYGGRRSVHKKDMDKYIINCRNCGTQISTVVADDQVFSINDLRCKCNGNTNMVIQLIRIKEENFSEKH